MTLAELMISTAIGSVVALGIAALTFYTGRSFAAIANYIDLDNQSRNALDNISKQIRQANKLTSFSTNSLTFEDSDGTPLQFSWDPAAQTLTRIKNGVADKPLLKECISCEFSIFQRNPVNGAYNQYPAASASTCKLVQLHWICRRTTLGKIINTESVQSAKVVIRKQ